MLGGDDPYQQIYLNSSKDNWWRLVKEELINPAHLDENGESIKEGEATALSDVPVTTDFERFQKNLDKARKLQARIEEKYHPNTYASYAADANQPAWNEVCWTSDQPLSGDLQSAPTLHDDLNGMVKLSVDGHRSCFEIADPKGPGDGTVPAESGEAPTPHVVQIFRHEGKAKGHDSYGHTGSYKSPLVHAVTAYAIVKIVAGSDWLKENICHA